jgi:hypothetical protein
MAGSGTERKGESVKEIFPEPGEKEVKEIIPEPESGCQRLPAVASGCQIGND